ncbi:unnamed protein product, partial [Hapterophycus canaliculatus]
MCSDKQLTSLVWALGHANQDVLTYTSWTVLDVKEGLLGAIWLLACDVGNTARLALNGGLQVLVGVLNFPCSACYVPLKTLAVGTLCKLCRIEPDVATLAMHLSMAPALLQAACGSFFAASLSVGARSRHHLQDNGGLEALCRLLRAKNAKEALKTRSLHAILNLSTETGCQPSICRWTLQPLVDLTVSGAPPQSEFASSILCNCVENPWCRAIMFEGQLARGSKYVTAARADEESEDSIRSSPWASRLAASNASAARTVREQFLSWVKEVKEGGSNTPTADYAGQGRGNAQVMCGFDNGEGARQSEINPIREDGSVSAKPSPRRGRGRGGANHGGGVGSKVSTPPKKSGSGVDAMVRVRQDLRQPVTSLWQTATERAATAPTRSVSHSGGMVDSTTAATRRDLSRRRPFSHISATKAKGSRMSMPSTVAANDVTNDAETAEDERQHVGGKGATVPSADGGNRSNSRRRASREGEPANIATANNTGFEVPVYGSVGQATDRDPRGRKTTIPLRSSHRIGPVGSLGSTSLPAGEYRWKPFVSDCFTKPNPLPAWRKRQITSPETISGTPGDTRGSSPLMGAPPIPANSEPTREERDAIFNQAVKENQTIVVVEPPLNYKLVFDGPTNIGPAKLLANPVSMTLFPHVRGASVCGPLYDHYVAEDGLCYHLYHTSRVICEVLDPGGYPPLSEPTELRHVLRKTLPEAPPPDYPS